MASGSGRGSMSLSMKFIRLLIVLFNLAFVVVGTVVVAVGVFVLKDPKMQQLRPLLNPDIVSTYSERLSTIETFAIALIVIGAVLLAIGFLGCCGAIKGFRFLHFLYAIIVALIIIAEVAIVVAFLAYQTRFRTELVTRLQDSIAQYYVGTPLNNATWTNPVSLAWDFAQFNLKCCGAIDATDFSRAANWDRKNPYQENANLSVPFTCCPLGAAPSWTELPKDFSQASACAKSGADAYSRGCYDRLVDTLAQYKNNVLIGCIVVGVVEVLAFLFAILLYCRKEEYVTL